MSATLDDVVRKLDQLIELVRTLNADALTDARRLALADDIGEAVFEQCADWHPAGELVRKVADGANVNERTVQRRIADLVARGHLESRGATNTLQYKRVDRF